MEELETQVAVLTLLNEPGAFKDSLSKNPSRAIDKIQVRVERYIYLEETQKAMANSGKNHGAQRSSLQREERLRREAQTPRVEKFCNYTPLNVSLTNLYKEVE